MSANFFGLLLAFWSGALACYSLKPRQGLFLIPALLLLVVAGGLVFYD